MNNTTMKIIQDYTKTCINNPNATKAELEEFKQVLIDLYSSDQLTASEHCDLEAIVDTAIQQREPILDWFEIAYFLANQTLSNEDKNRLFEIMKKAGKQYLYAVSFDEVKDKIFEKLDNYASWR